MYKRWGTLFIAVIMAFITSFSGVPSVLAATPVAVLNSGSINVYPPAPTNEVPGPLPKIDWKFSVRATNNTGDNSKLTIGWTDPGSWAAMPVYFRLQSALDTDMAKFKSLEEFCAYRSADGPWQDISKSADRWKILSDYLTGGDNNTFSGGGGISSDPNGTKLAVTLDQVRVGRPQYFRLLLDGSRIPHGSLPGLAFAGDYGGDPNTNGVSAITKWFVPYPNHYILACTQSPIKSSNEINSADTTQYTYGITTTLDGAAQVDGKDITATIKAIAVATSKELTIPKNTSPAHENISLTDVPRDKEVKFQITYNGQTAVSQLKNEASKEIAVNFHKDGSDPTVTVTDADAKGQNSTQAEAQLTDNNSCSKYLGFGFGSSFAPLTFLTCELYNTQVVIAQYTNTLIAHVIF